MTPAIGALVWFTVGLAGWGAAWAIADTAGSPGATLALWLASAVTGGFLVAAGRTIAVTGRHRPRLSVMLPTVIAWGLSWLIGLAGQGLTMLGFLGPGFWGIDSQEAFMGLAKTLPRIAALAGLIAGTLLGTTYWLTSRKVQGRAGWHVVACSLGWALAWWTIAFVAATRFVARNPMEPVRRDIIADILILAASGVVATLPTSIVHALLPAKHKHISGTPET
jgi:hypothetical protein